MLVGYTGGATMRIILKQCKSLLKYRF